MKDEIIERIKYLQDKVGNPFDEQLDYIGTVSKIEKLKELLALLVD